MNDVCRLWLGRLAYALVLTVIASNAVGADLVAPTDKALIQALRSGGYNVYFRHAQTNWSLSDHVTTAGDWTSCDPARMRQLSDEGRQTAKAVGDAMRALNIPVDRVLASPYCRTVETANLLGLGPVETTTDIMNLRSAAYFGGRHRIVERARARLARTPPTGTNTVLVAHGNVAREATPVYPDEAEAVVFRPDGSGGFEFVGRLKPRQWLALVSKFESESP